ncbi:MAG: hypothetical protein ABIO70_36060 [Pseudomonadota bacterium]
MPTPSIFILLVAATMAAPPVVPTSLEVAGQPVRDLTCSFLEGAELAEAAISHTLVDRKASLDRCSADPTEVRVQWSWGGDKGATIVVTRAPDEALADCVEAALTPEVQPIIGYCVGHLPLDRAEATAAASQR